MIREQYELAYRLERMVNNQRMDERTWSHLMDTVVDRRVAIQAIRSAQFRVVRHTGYVTPGWDIDFWQAKQKKLTRVLTEVGFMAVYGAKNSA